MKKRQHFPVKPRPKEDKMEPGEAGSAQRKAFMRWVTGQILGDMVEDLEWSPSVPQPPPDVGHDAWTGTVEQDGGLIMFSVLKMPSGEMFGVVSAGSLTGPLREPEGMPLSQEMLHRIYRHIDKRRPV